MEERKRSSEQPEEVIELLDIVAQSASDEKAVQAEESALLSDGADEAEQPEKNDLEEVGDCTEVGEEAVLLEESAVLEQGDVEHSEAGQAVFSAEESGGEGASKNAVGTDDGCDAASENGETADAEDERLLVLKRKHEAEVKALEERVASLEKMCRELEESVESLSQQIAQAGTMFLEDASVRLNMEELVSRMLDARLPASSDQEDGEAADLGARVDGLEKRVQEWEKKSEQTAASAAARVIRDEIAAMRAEAETRC
ncbi:hypothetical protein [uncultured Mailhella sp.]|uniref:hypothetical protein n=1 Tax=uncultured Mailhella sp. TaxID=1981031 RepID=UPI0025EC71BD|nr:hypothetical protein [uncultured Mailhella sp.]